MIRSIRIWQSTIRVVSYVITGQKIGHTSYRCLVCLCLDFGDLYGPSRIRKQTWIRSLGVAIVMLTWTVLCFGPALAWSGSGVVRLSWVWGLTLIWTTHLLKQHSLRGPFGTDAIQIGLARNHRNPFRLYCRLGLCHKVPQHAQLCCTSPCVAGREICFWFQTDHLCVLGGLFAAASWVFVPVREVCWIGTEF